MAAELFSDGQVAALVGGVLAAGGAIAGALRWGLDRGAKAFDEMARAFNRMADEHKTVTQGLIELRAEVREGRQDISELRDQLATRRTGRGRAATPAG